MNGRESAALLFSYCVIGSIFILSVWNSFNSSHLLSSELPKYLAHYLGPGTILEKVYNVRGSDTIPEGMYRPRDLGTLFNYLDAELILAGFRFGMRGIVSPMNYIGLLGFCIILLYYTNKYFGHSARWITFGCILLLLLAPASFFAGVYNRSSKMMVSLLFALVFWMMYGVYRSQSLGIKHIVPLPIVLIAMALTDEVGIAFLVGFCTVTTLAAFVYKTKPVMMLSLLCLLSIGVTVLYRYYIGPFMVLQAIGIWPRIWDVNVQSLKDGALLGQVLETFFAYIGYLFGNSGFVGAAGVTVGLLYLINRAQGHHFWVMVYMVGAAWAIIALALQAAALPSIVLPAPTLVSYPVAYNALFIVVACAILCQATAKHTRGRAVVVVSLLTLSAFNAVSLPSHARLIAELSVGNTNRGAEIIEPILSTGPFEISRYNLSGSDAINAVSVIRARLGK